VSSKPAAALIFFLAFLALLVAMHLPYLQLPFFWDEVGQFIPAALDLYHEGAWVAHSTLPNVHPPGLMAVLALIWRVFGFSIVSTRLTMLAIASSGLLFSFLLAIRLARAAAGAPAFAAVIFLIAAPIFYTQAMLAQLDMPAMALTALALWLFLEERYAASAVACVASVLMKETTVTTPLVFAAWLWFREERRRETLYFLAPAAVLAAWLVVLTRATGHVFGNREFTDYNVIESLSPVHFLLSLGRRIYYLFIGNGHFIGALAIFAGWRALLGKEWTIAALVGGAQVLMVTVFGGAMLDRYLLPVFPVVYAAMAAGASAYPASWRWISQTAMLAVLLSGWFWNPPYPFPFENNLAMIDFVRLQQDAAGFLEAWAPDKTIASAWPLTDELQRPEFGYVHYPLRVVQSAGFRLGELASIDRSKVGALAVYSQMWPLEGRALDFPVVRRFLRRYSNYDPIASPEEIRMGLGYVPVARWRRGGQWVDIYVPER
jgi:4-amino-4-deoxy-L-arabinose transferase-like glycosyltransferase